MRKIYVALLSLFSFLIISQNSFGQNANTYIFSVAGGGSLDPMTGATTIVNSGVDDTPSPIQNIGFSFTYEGVAYTQFSASPDGFIKLGSPAATGQFTNAITSTSNVPKLFPFWDDLATGTTGNVSYVVTGTAPNQILKVQWFVTVPRATGGAANTTFQVWLYEGTNVIEFRYGVGVGPASSASIGINGLTATNFISVTTPANTTSTAVANNSNTALPSSETIYTFTPPPPCSGTPAGGTTQSTLAAACSGVNFTLSVTGSPMATGLTYQWESSPDGSAWTNIGGATAADYTTTQSVPTYYRRKITCSGNDNWSTPLFIPMSVATLPLFENFSGYLTTFPPVCWTRNNATFIAGFAQSGYGVGSGSVRFNFYSASTNTQLDLVTPEFTPATGFFLTFDHAYATFSGENDRLELWTSTDAGANYTLLTTYNGGTSGPLNTFGGSGATGASFAPTASQWGSKAIALPAGTNKIRLRGVSAFGNNLFLDNIRITSCAPPTGLSVTAITTSTATANWTASASNPSGGYQWEVRSSGGAGSGPAGLAASGTTAVGVTTANIAGLTSFTQYNLYVRSDCGGSDFSAWAGPFAFTTDCDPVLLPLFEDFSTYLVTFPPTCWTRNNNTLLLSSGVSAYGAGSGSARFNFYSASSGTQLDLRTPSFTPTGAGFFLMFDHAYATFFGENDRLEIWYSTDGGSSYTLLTNYNGGTSGPLNTGGSSFGSFIPASNQWANKVIALPTGTNRLIFRGVSAFGNDLYIDNIRITSCLPPTGLTSSAETQTTATISWTASASNPSGGYQWEVRSSGAPGSGATGLVTSGVTAAGVTTANVTGLSAGTAYSVYVRSDCGGSDFSAWTSAYNLITLCDPITTFPYTETFEDASPTRICWRNQTLSGGYSWTYGAGSGNGGPVTSAHGGLVNARYFGSGYGGELALLVSPEFDLSSPGMAANGADLEFWMANPSWLGDINPLRVLYKAAPADPWTVLPGAVYSSPVNSWTKIEIENLPNISSTYYIAFEGTQLWGWGLAIDDVVIKEGPSCRKPRNVRALGVTPTSAEVYFTSPGTSFIVEYGAPGFTPGTGAAAGAGGTIVVGAASPITVTGLTASTTYDFYIRRVCIPGADYSENVKVTATTLCDAVNIPYFQNFESAIVPAMPTCTSVEDVNGNSGSFWLGTGAGSWETYTDANPLTYVSPSTSLLYFYDFNDLTRPADDWFYLRGLNLTAGTTYRLKFFYKGLDGANFPERLEVKYGLAASAANMTAGTIFNNSNISSVYGGAFDSVRVDFTPTADGVYYIGFHAYSFADRFGILIDDVSVREAPLLDVGISSITLPNLSCPANNVFIQAAIRNYDINTVDFAVTPVNVNARIIRDGTNITNLPATLINSGTIAPNGTMNIFLGTAFNFVAGSYEIILNTTSAGDIETVNDTLRTTLVVNPVPAAPAVTPAAPQVCLGNTVQLTVAATTPIVTATSATTGAISVAIPDGSAVGATSTLAISGIPSTATITGITVRVNMTHTWISDMVVNLRAPNGRVLNLFNRRGGSGDNLTNTVFSSASTTSLATGTPPYTGTFAADAAAGVGPTGNAADATAWSDLYSVGSGNWVLALRDYVGFDAGTLTNWSITINYSYFPAVTWSPVTELFTNAAATTPYVAGANAYTVWAKPTTTRTYTATATGAGGCNATTNVPVTVNPNPVVTAASLPSRICLSDTLVPLVGTPAGGSWSGIGASGNNFVPSATAVGTYTLTYNYSNVFGCPGSATTLARVEDCPERIVLLRDNAVVLFPNPTNGGRFNIRINSVLYNRLGMSVYTNNGTLVRTQQFNGLVYGRVIPIDLSALPGGTYIVKFYYDEAGPRTADKSFKVIIGH